MGDFIWALDSELRRIITMMVKRDLVNFIGNFLMNPNAKITKLVKKERSV
jgi:hypothetical protein